MFARYFSSAFNRKACFIFPHFSAHFVCSALVIIRVCHSSQQKTSPRKRQLSDEEYHPNTTAPTFCIHPLSSNVPELTSCAPDLLQQTRAAAAGCYGNDACHLAPFLGVAERTLDLKSASTTWKLHARKQQPHFIIAKQPALSCSRKRQHTAWPTRQSF